MSAVTAHQMRRYANDLRKEADQLPPVGERTRELLQAADLMEAAAAARDAMAGLDIEGQA